MEIEELNETSPAPGLRADKKRSFAYGLLIFASIFLYVILTGSKSLYTAEKITFYDLGIFGDFTDLASTMEYYFYTYAVTQILLIFFMKKMNVKWFLTVTLGISGILTLIMPFTETVVHHYIIFSINGVLQAGLWGCLLKILSNHLPARLLPLANQIMASGPALAGALAYGVAAMFGDNWRTPFLVLGIILLCAVALYFISVTYMSRFPREIQTHHVVRSDGTEEDVDDEVDNDFIHLDSRRRVVFFFAFSLLMGFLFTSLFYMVNNNLDVYLKEIGNFSNDTAKILTVLAPICAVLGPLMTVRSCERHKNFVVVCGVYYGVATLFAGLLLIFFDKSVLLSLVMLALFLVFVNGGRSVTLSIASLRMRKKIDTGVYSTAVNSISSIAAGISPKIITVLLDNSEYNAVQSWRASFLIIFVWSAVVVALLTSFVLLIKYINRNRVKATE